MRPGLLRATGAAALALVCLFLTPACSSDPPKAAAEFRELVEELSERGGYFDTDNLISNETAYTQVVHALEPAGGVYIGVGPEQNFHYIGRIRPSWAFIVDIRRDNMLHHLLLNAILVNAGTPYDYLCWLFSRRCPARSDADGFEVMVGTVEDSPPDAVRFRENLKRVFEHVEGRLDFRLGPDDRDVIEEIYREFFEAQLGLQFRSHGRRPMPYHPTYHRLLTARGPEGDPSHFLSRPEDYAHVRDLAEAGRLIPVVGDFAGDHALRAIGRFAEERGEEVSAFYVSNVEFYLMRNRRFRSYVENLKALPFSNSGQIIRAYFSYGYPHPAALPGHRSTLVRQKAARFLALYEDGAYQNYWDVSTLDYER